MHRWSLLPSLASIGPTEFTQIPRDPQRASVKSTEARKPMVCSVQFRPVPSAFLDRFPRGHVHSEIPHRRRAASYFRLRK